MTDIEISFLGSSESIVLWPSLEPHINKAIKNTSLKDLIGIDDIKHNINKGDIKVVTFHDNYNVHSVVLLFVSEWPLSRVCEVFAAGACCEYSVDWVWGLSKVMEYAKDTLKCDKVAINGRIGWKKVLDSFEFEDSGCRLIRSI